MREEQRDCAGQRTDARPNQGKKGGPARDVVAVEGYATTHGDARQERHRGGERAEAASDRNR